MKLSGLEKSYVTLCKAADQLCISRMDVKIKRTRQIRNLISFKMVKLIGLPFLCNAMIAMTPGANEKHSL